MAFQHVGRPIKRVEDPRLITGADRYVVAMSMMSVSPMP